MKTIKQIADEIGVSKTAVRKKIENLGLRSSLQYNGNQFAIDEEQEMLIKSAFEGKSETETETKSQTESETVSALVSMLQNELDVKNQQIAELNERLAECQRLLDQQQHLNAVSEQKVLQLEDKTAKKKSLWGRLFGGE